MSVVQDTEAVYPRSRKTAAFAELIGDILGSAKAGRQIMNKLIPLGEDPTDKNIRDRLRLTLIESNESTDKIPGATAKQTARLKAAWSLTQGLYFAKLQEGKVVDDPSIAAEAFQAMSWQPVEQFAVLSLDCKHRILSSSIISSGTATETLAHPRDIFGAVMRSGGTRCIVGHNHPSGSLDASKEDLVLTKQLLECSKALGIPILDHLIVARGEFASIRQTYGLWTAE